MVLRILALGILTVFFSCGQPNEQKNIAVAASDTLQANVDKKERDRLERRKEIEAGNIADSLRLDKILQDALKIAHQNFGKERFDQHYEVSADSMTVSVGIDLDYYFTKASPHLIIRRDYPSTVHIDIYSKTDREFKKVITHKQWALTYVNDTIRDINGDGLNDFVVNWYGASGCCLKAFSDVYLLRHDQKSFSGGLEFVNPTFSAKEKVIRGVCYGHPGETELYKYKWNGEKVDTLEYVSYEKNKKGVKTGKIVILTGSLYGGKYRTVKILNSVPKEYRNIEGYDWFTGTGYD